MGPQRIVCLTEETTEWLYLLGEDARIVGISGYTVRPRRARQEKPRVSAFLDGKIDKIVALQPDLVIGFSDMQAALADKLIRAGLNVLITNQRSVAEIVGTLRLVAGLVGAQDRAEAWIAGNERAARDRRRQCHLAAPPAGVLRGVGRADDQRHPVGVAAGRHGRWRRRVP
jgi:iron complex transport system substrate-binding protein